MRDLALSVLYTLQNSWVVSRKHLKRRQKRSCPAERLRSLLWLMQVAVSWHLHQAGCCKNAGHKDVIWGTRRCWHQCLEVHEANANVCSGNNEHREIPIPLTTVRERGTHTKGTPKKETGWDAEEARALGRCPCLGPNSTFSVLQIHWNLDGSFSFCPRFWYFVAIYFNFPSLAKRRHLSVIFLSSHKLL